MRTPDGVLLHAWRAGSGRIEAGLADYAFFVRGLLRLHEATGEARWLDEARRLTDEQVARLGSARGGFFNSADAPDLLVRGKEIFDGALPGANGVAAWNLIDLHRAAGGAGRSRWLDLALATARAFAPLVDRHPEGAKTMALALAALQEIGVGVEAEAGFEAGRTAGSGVAALAAEAGEQLRAEAILEGGELEEGWLPLRLRVAVADGWHVAADTFRVDAIDMELAGVTLPEPRSVGDDPTAPSVPGAAGFAGEFEIRARARARPGMEEALPRILLRYQACDDRRCLPPAALEVELRG
jgi:hypothetical protein